MSLGAVIYYIVIQFVLTAGLNTNDLKLITALVVAIFLAIPYWKGKYFSAVSQDRGRRAADMLELKGFTKRSTPERSTRSVRLTTSI